MKSLRANVLNTGSPERRNEVRWRVELIVTAGPAYDLGRASVRNLSERGLMLQTDAQLEVGEMLVIDFPGMEPAEARIVWREDYSYGCEFAAPISPAAISEILLKAPAPQARPKRLEPKLEEFPVAVSPTVSQLAEWKAEFQRTKAKEGYRLIAFRQTGDGLFIAVAAKEDEGGKVRGPPES